MKEKIERVTVHKYNYSTDELDSNPLFEGLEFESTEVWGYDESDNLVSICLLSEEGMIWYWNEFEVKLIDSCEDVMLVYSDVFGLRFWNDNMTELDKQYYRKRFLAGLKIDHCLSCFTDLHDLELRKLNHWVRGRF